MEGFGNETIKLLFHFQNLYLHSTNPNDEILDIGQ